LYTRPRTNAEWWAQKVAANKARDRRKERALRALGLRVLTVWQCELRNRSRLTRRITSFLERTQRAVAA
jgi:DNA mismatch endonuclease (patch repair protein)